MSAEASHCGGVVLAAGLGTRFRSDQAKVMHRIGGRTLLRHVLEALRPLGLSQVVVVVGHQWEEVAADAMSAGLPGLATVLQAQQLGTGHAAAQALRALDEAVERVLILPGDTPLLTAATLERLLAAGAQASAALLTVQFDDPTGYGRILRDEAGRVLGVVEEADATEHQRSLREANAGMYLFERGCLADALGRLAPVNAQGELYLTDVVGILVGDGREVEAVSTAAEEVSGVNDRVQLAAAGAMLRDRTLERLMRDGVTVLDPATTYVDVDVSVGRDSILLPGCLLEGRTRVGQRVTLGPYTRLVDAEVQDGATVAQSVVISASVGPDASVGPFTYLRPGTRLERGAKAGGFVEMKNATIGEGSKVPHLSYVGDARLGRGVNFSAGAITCNYDGFRKHETIIEDDAFVGSDNMLVAPVRIGRGAFTAAGSVITKDVPDDALALERNEQRTIEGWAARKREQRQQGRGE
ncbi:MAG: bifunctional UDP-N-acetylglucosamine diphosphorylase/glucosamine-1-phosphate N-acetyltransferase GlmU [Actinomycetota bacterium]|nr:bifunctional UDP-N-acetylglucosamine diphosphorylase/glucosamine-1-phosphate N-acetyltransferase GlmU [Actinomycetota bacterium]